MKMSEKELRATGVSILMTMFYSASFGFIGWLSCLCINQIFFNQKPISHDSIFIIVTISWVFGTGIHLIAEKIERTKKEILEKLPSNKN
jgi:hypothetical protein